MSKKDLFNATKQTMSLYGGFFKDVAQEVGMEKALVMHANQGKAVGAGLAATLKAELGRKKINLAALESVTTKMVQSLGMEPKIEKKRGVLKEEHLRCPLYEGLSSAGLDHDTIETMCKQLSVLEYAEITKAFPNVSASVKFRATAAEPCIEEFTILK